MKSDLDLLVSAQLSIRSLSDENVLLVEGEDTTWTSARQPFREPKLPP